MYILTYSIYNIYNTNYNSLTEVIVFIGYTEGIMLDSFTSPFVSLTIVVIHIPKRP
jgi:hypothetical protein